LKKITATLALVILASMSAAASNQADVMAVVRKWANSFNSGDAKTGNTVCSDEAVVIDDFPPHVWQGPGACSRWFKDYEALAARTVTTDGKIMVGETRHFDIELGYAYLVAPVTLSYSRGGKLITETGVITMVLHKGAAGWLITGWTWADQ
jgi:ketosteroid isomerase-like protein